MRISHILPHTARRYGRNRRLRETTESRLTPAIQSSPPVYMEFIDTVSFHAFLFAVAKGSMRVTWVHYKKNIYISNFFNIFKN